MNYNDEILEQKAFNFFKQLMYNIALALCILLLGALIMVYGFKFQLYNVKSNSEAPYFYKGDMVVVKEQESYEVGDILTFNQGGALVSHRLLAIFTEKKSEITYYLCHGDANGSTDSSKKDEITPWEEDAAFVQNIINENPNITLAELTGKADDLQATTLGDIKGIVIAKISNYGTYLEFIQNHAGLFIALVAGIWCISSVVQNELEMKRARRLL